MGAVVAYELACAGASVALVDAGHHGRASDAGAGIASPETFHEPDEEWFAFGAAAAAYLRTLVDRLAEEGSGPGHDGFARCGSLVVALAEHEDPWFAEVAGRAGARDPAIAEIATDEARSMFPALGPLWRALYSPAAARVDGRLLCDALRLAGERRGVAIHHLAADGVERDGDRVTALRVGDDVISCHALVLAGGAWSSSAGRWLGLDLPVTPTRGQIVHVVVPGADANTSDSWPIVQPVLNFYLVPWPGGRVACGGTFEPEAGFDVRPTAAGVRDLMRECLAIAPGLAGATFTEVRVGLRPTSADDRPLLGAAPAWENVHLCTGHGANGLLLGPFSGALVAAGVLGQPPGTLTPFSPTRFSGV